MDTLPTKTDGSIGRTKSALPGSDPSPNLDYYETALEHERIKDFLIAVCVAVGLADGSTAGSVIARLLAAEGALANVSGLLGDLASDALRQSTFSGTHAGSLVRTGAGAYEARRIEAVNSLFGHGSPLASDDSTQGYGVGSIWVQTSTEPGGAPVSIWVCMSAAEGAAVWREIASASSVPALTSTAAAAHVRYSSAGSAPTAARADHTHDGGKYVHSSPLTGTASLSDADLVFVDTTSGAVTINLPAVTTGAPRWYTLKKIGADANSITLARAGSEKIEGVAANFVLPSSTSTARPSWTIARDSLGAWWVL